MLLQTFKILDIEHEEDTNQIFVTLCDCIVCYRKNYALDNKAQQLKKNNSGTAAKPIGK